MAKLISNVLKDFISEIKEYEESNENIPKQNKRASALFIGVLTEDGYLKSYAWDEHDDTGDIINILSNGFLDDIATFEIAKRLHMIKDVDPTLYEEVFLELQNTPFKNGIFSDFYGKLFLTKFNQKNSLVKIIIHNNFNIFSFR